MKLSEKSDLAISERSNLAFFAMRVLESLLSTERRSLRISDLILVRGLGPATLREVLLTGRHQGDQQRDQLLR